MQLCFLGFGLSAQGPSRPSSVALGRGRISSICHRHSVYVYGYARAMLRYACAWLPPLCLTPVLPPCLSPFVSSSLRPHTWPPCSSILLISPRVTLGFFVPSFSPSHVISPASLRLSYVLNFFLLLHRLSRFRSLGPVMVPMCWSENVIVVVTVAVVVVHRCRRGGNAGVVVGGGPVRREGKE